MDHSFDLCKRESIMTIERLKQQLNFIVEIDRLKQVFRKARLLDKSRYENDAEHSWHQAMMAIILQEHANEKVDITRVVKMNLIHDIVEIDAGDTFAYDTKGYEDKEEREEAAAQRIFGLLPQEQFDEVYQLWKEFEACETPEAKFANALDRFQPLLHNYYTEGYTWKKYGISAEQVLQRNQHKIEEGSDAIWRYAQQLITDAIEKEYLRK